MVTVIIDISGRETEPCCILLLINRKVQPWPAASKMNADFIDSSTLPNRCGFRNMISVKIMAQRYAIGDARRRRCNPVREKKDKGDREQMSQDYLRPVEREH